MIVPPTDPCLRFPPPGERGGVPNAIIPVLRDVHGAKRAAFSAEQPAPDPRPVLIFGQGTQADVRRVPALAVETADRAGDVSISQPLSRAAGRISA